MKYKEFMSNILSGTMPSWMKDQDEKDFRIVRKVYSIGDLRNETDDDVFSSRLSKPSFEKFKQHLSSSTNLTLNNTSTLGKLLVRKLRTNMTKSTIDLRQNSEQNLQFIQQISKGKLVFKALYRTKQDELIAVAVKKCKQNDVTFDLSMIRDLKHPHIVQLYDIVIHSNNSLMFVIEYAPLKSLYDCLITQNSKCEYSIITLLEYLKQIGSAMSYLEKKLLVHKNLSCKNYLVFNKSLIKLSDMGFSSKSSNAWMSPEVIKSQHYTTASDVYSFGISMWECFTYGEIPPKNLITDDIIRQLSKPDYATSELYDIMIHCWKYNPADRPTFCQLEKLLSNILLKQVRWKENNNLSKNLPDGFLSIESCRLGPLIILDQDLHLSTTSNLIQCVTVDGQIGLVDKKNIEAIDLVPKNSTTLTMNSIFHRKTVSKDMISSPQTDLVHSFHVGITGETFGDISCLNNTEKTESIIDEQNSSLFDEVMQAFTDIYIEKDVLSKDPPSQIKFLDESTPSLINRYINNSPLIHDEHSTSSSTSTQEKFHSRSSYSSISSSNSRSSSINKHELQEHSVTGQPLPPPPDLSSLGNKLTKATMAQTFQLPDISTSYKYRTKKRFHLFT